MSPIPLLNNAFRPALLLLSLPGRSGKLDMNFEVGVEFGAFVVKEDDIGGIAEPKEEGFLLFSINDGDIDFGGDEGGEYCCEVFPATLIACSAAYRAAASTCSTLDGLADFDLRPWSDGDGERSNVDWPFVPTCVKGDFLSFFRLSESVLVSLYSGMDC